MDSTPRILGTLHIAEGAGVVRIADRLASDAADVWRALTDPGSLADWYGPIAGDLVPGGEFRIRLDGPDIDSAGRVVACTPQVHLRVTTRETDESAARGGGRPFDQTVEVTLTPDGGGTRLVAGIHGLPVAKLAAYGIGWQLHLEALTAHLAGRPAHDPGTRWAELAGPYGDLAAALDR